MLPTPPPTLADATVPDTREVLAMGTRLTLRLQADAAERALEAVAHVEAFGSTWRTDTPWSRMAATPGTWTPQSLEAWAVLAAAAEWSRRTGGAFDPMLAPLVRTHGLRTGGRIPSAREHQEALALCGLRHLELDPTGSRARVLSPGAGIEEGGFLKGHALDRARLTAGTPEGLMDFGGQLLAWGRPVAAGIADPKERHRERLRLRLADASLSTTSCSERGRHLLDPASGEPCPAWGSVSVVHPSAFVADLLSTALYVMGPRKGPTWAQAHDVAAVFLTHEGHCLASPAFARLKPLLIER